MVTEDRESPRHFVDEPLIPARSLLESLLFRQKRPNQTVARSSFSWPPNCVSSKRAASLSRETSARRRWSTPLSMTFIVAAVLGGFAILAAAIAGLLVQRRALRALRESLEQFRLTANQAPVLIWTARPDTSLDYLNGFCEQLTGRPLEQLRENGWLDFVHPEDVDRCLATYMPAFEARKPFLLEYRLRHADGEYRWFLASGVPKHGRDGSFTGYVGCDPAHIGAGVGELRDALQ